MPTKKSHFNRSWRAAAVYVRVAEYREAWPPRTPWQPDAAYAIRSRWGGDDTGDGKATDLDDPVLNRRSTFAFAGGERAATPGTGVHPVDRPICVNGMRENPPHRAEPCGRFFNQSGKHPNCAHGAARHSDQSLQLPAGISA